MNRRFTARFVAGWLILTLALLAYFSIASLLTGEVYTSVGVLFFILLIWFLIYKLRHESLGNVGLIKRMYADSTGAVERLKERLAEDEASRRAAADRRRQVLINQESKKTDTPKEFPVDRAYADLIERRVRESRAKQDQGESTHETEP
jgi:hypothetical protein